MTVKTVNDHVPEWLQQELSTKEHPLQQGFPQVLRTWGFAPLVGSSKFDGGNLSQYMGEPGEA